MKALLLLPTLPIHVPHWADTRHPRSAVRLHTAGLEASLGESLALVGQDLPSGFRWRAGLEAGAFMNFEPAGELTFSLLTFDGVFGVPIDIAWQNWRGRVEWTHLSAHFADGIRHGDELPDPDHLGAFSREWLGMELGYQFHWLQPYAGLRWLVHSADGGAGGTILSGLIVQSDESPGWYGGLDVQSRQELNWAVSGSMELGIQWTSERGTMQLGLCAYSGMDDTGKRIGAAKQYLGLLFALGPSFPSY